MFPVEDTDVSLSGGLFRNSISRKAKSYYSKFEKNGNMTYTNQSTSGLVSNLIKMKKGTN